MVASWAMSAPLRQLTVYAPKPQAVKGVRLAGGWCTNILGLPIIPDHWVGLLLISIARYC
jgi:hypothetical protein